MPDDSASSSSLRSVPVLKTQPPSSSSDEHDGKPTEATSVASNLTDKFIRPPSSSLNTDTESDSGYLSTQSAPVLDQEAPRLSVFSRRPIGRIVANDGEKRTMTIETETVANISSTVGFKNDHHARSLRTKTSADTVRASQKPKRKKSKVAVTNANHVPTKSEIFAATITQAVDENEDSDSEETFVYESNPRSPRKISRSPSISSMHSGFGERHASSAKIESTRYNQGLHLQEDRERDKILRTHAICGKRSMKFANNPYEEEAPRRHASAATSRHGNLFESTTATARSPKPRPSIDRRVTSPGSSGQNSPRHSTPASPRNAPLRYGIHQKRDRKKETSFRPWNVYEDEEGEGSSERSPFLRRKTSSYRQKQPRRQNMWSGIPFIMAIICLMFVVLVIGAAALSTSQPLRDVKVVNITNVLVSKQELILDLVVEAYNPNALAISVNDVEISIFAQSPYVREVQNPTGNFATIVTPLLKSAREINQQHQRHPESFAGFWPPWLPGSGTNNSDDYPDNGEDSTTLLLGRVVRLDSTLTFESRFFNRSVSTSRGEIRVIKPGNVTEPNGVETWERVIQHSFELIIRGVMKYQSSGLSHVIRSSELYKTAHINPSKVDLSEGF